MDKHTGMRLSLEGRKSLTIGSTALEFHDPTAAKASRGSCSSLLSGPRGQDLLPFYNVLWAEQSNGRISIDYAVLPSKVQLNLEKWSFAVSSADESSEGGESGDPFIDGSVESSPEAFVSALLDRAYGQALRRKRVYVLVNPSAGPGKGAQQWDEEVRPVFEAARMPMEFKILSRGGEATELAEKVDIDRYDAIVACSGDGTPHEIFNGLGMRPDARTALARIAVCQIPCGSGNAMSCNLCDSNHPAVAALALAKGLVTPMDLMSITHGDMRILSFLSQSVGIIADSDLGTEDWRWMGSTRFELGVALRLFLKKCYPFDLAVKVEVEKKEDIKAHYKRHKLGTNPAEQPASKGDGIDDGEGLPVLKYGTVQDQLPDGWEMVSYDEVGNFYCGNMAYMAPELNFFSASAPSDGCMDLMMIKGTLSLYAAMKTIRTIFTDKFLDQPHVSYKKIKAYRIIPRKQETGFISVDGEGIPFGPFQAEVHRGLGRVISKSGWYEAPGPAGWKNVPLPEGDVA